MSNQKIYKIGEPSPAWFSPVNCDCANYADTGTLCQHDVEKINNDHSCDHGVSLDDPCNQCPADTVGLGHMQEHS